MRPIGPIVTGFLVFVAAFGYMLPWPALLDDHFMHVVWGRQLLAGRMLLRDMVEPGLPLQAALSAAAELVFGYRLLSEAAIVCLALATGALLTFLLARRASGSAWVGLVGAVLQVAIAPRSYSYPKILVYAVGLTLVWRYIERPSRSCAAVLGVAVATAFYLRHDHGVYLGLITVLFVGLRHAREWRLGVRRVTVTMTAAAAAVLPFLVYVHLHSGIDRYVGDLLAFAVREHQQNRFERWPDWPIRSVHDVAVWNAAGPPRAQIGVRWRPDATQENRRDAAAKHGLMVPDEGPLESGEYTIADLTRENSLALINNPAIEDTAGVDRGSGIIQVRELWVGPLHVLPALTEPDAAAALLLYTYIGLALGTLLALIRPQQAWRGPLGEWERLEIGAVAAVAILTALAFLREPLAARIADAVVAPVVLGAWWAGRWLKVGSADRSWRSVAVRTAVAFVLLAAVAKSVGVVGAVPARLEALGLLPGTTPGVAWSAAWRQLWASPPFDAWDAVGTAKHRVARYVRSCTAPHEPLLVLWFAPDLHYYADRPFAGRLGFYMEGYWASEEHERANLARLERDRPVLAIAEEGREDTDLYTYPALVRYVAASYTEIGRVAENDGSIIRVLARTERAPTSIDAELGWPCYR